MREHIITELTGYMLWVAGLPGQGFQRRIPDWWNYGVVYQDLRDRGITDADRKRLSRAVEALAEDGSIQRISRGNGAKTTHIRPSVDLLRSLLAADAESAESLRKALQRSAWGPELLKECES